MLRKAGFLPVVLAVHERVYGGDNKKSHQGADRKTSDKGFADWLDGFRSGSGKESDGKHSQDGG
jgi:hypothetical protein